MPAGFSGRLPSGVNRTSVRLCEMSAPDPKRTLGIFDPVDLAAIERASISGHGILNLVQILKDAIKHMREDFTACAATLMLRPAGHEYGRTHTSRSRRSQHWVKVKNPKAPAVRREAGGGLGH